MLQSRLNKMPSYKPLPKLAAHSPSERMGPTHTRPYSTQDESPPLSCPSRAYEKKRVDYHSRNKEPLETKNEAHKKAMHTYQPMYDIPAKKLEKKKENPPPKPKRFEYMESPEYRYVPEDLDRSDSSITSVFIAPSKAAKQNMDRLVKIKEKILKPMGDHSHDVDFSSMTHYSRSMTNGDGHFKDSIATLSIDQDEDDLEDFNNASKNISREANFNSNNKMANNYSNKSLNSYNTKSRERFEYYQSNEEVYDPKVMDSVSTARPGMNNIAISEHLQKAIEERKNDLNDYQNYVNKEIKAHQEEPDPNKNMINLENIIIIEKKISEISEGINTMVEINLLCEDWWEVTQEETMLMNLGEVFKEPKYKQILKQATLCE